MKQYINNWWTTYKCVIHLIIVGEPPSGVKTLTDSIGVVHTNLNLFKDSIFLYIFTTERTKNSKIPPMQLLEFQRQRHSSSRSSSASLNKKKSSPYYYCKLIAVISSSTTPNNWQKSQPPTTVYISENSIGYSKHYLW